jgi:hypothetical protein
MEAFGWNDENIGYLKFETCPIKIWASKCSKSNIPFDEVRINDKEIWSKICQYKGNNTPFAQLKF